jgi:hypothetical protein
VSLEKALATPSRLLELFDTSPGLVTIGFMLLDEGLTVLAFGVLKLLLAELGLFSRLFGLLPVLRRLPSRDVEGVEAGAEK